MNQIAQSLSRLRKSHGLTQQQLADRAGLSRMTIQRIEAGEDARLLTLMDVLRALDMELMIVPELLRTEVEQFVLADGRVLGQRNIPGQATSIADRLLQRAAAIE